MRNRKPIETIESRITNREILKTYIEVKKIIEIKKIITPDIKEKLIDLGFREAVMGCKDEHKITSKQVKIDFYGFDIAIGLSPVAINYGYGRRYRAMVITLKE
ncbi:MAG: hypothetical protein PHX62_03970 [Bacilli bacterium]|nr:hypothetical protein [Bacilli bacterium]